MAEFVRSFAVDIVIRDLAERKEKEAIVFLDSFINGSIGTVGGGCVRRAWWCRMWLMSSILEWDPGHW